MVTYSCDKMIRSTRQTFFLVFPVVFLIFNCAKGGVIPPSSKNKGHLLSTDPTCAQDVQKHCSKMNKENNFGVFICLQDIIYKDDEEISDDCHQTMWHYKYNLTTDSKFDDVASTLCETAISEVKECQDPKLKEKKGFFMNCLVENRHEVQDAKCKAFLNRMAAVIFSDYRLISGFYESCLSDVKTMGCGQITRPDDEHATESHEQSEVISCLENRFDEIKDQKCQKAILKVAEMQSDDYHMDRPLFYACQSARDKFCKDVKSGQGKIYECLIAHSQDEDMDSECASKLLSREKLMQKDVKVNYQLWTQCENDYIKYKCDEERKNLPDASEHGEASLLLLCLSKKNAEGYAISPGCQSEMRSFSKLVFEEYQVNPIVVAKCDKEIHDQCKHLIGKEKDEGEMMDCLMTLATSGNYSMSDGCLSAISEVLKETGASDNYKVDKALQIACEPAINVLCEGKQDSMVLSCLMDNIHNPKMPPVCAEQVFHLEYFLARDFRLDQQLYRDCKDDAKKICSANDWGAEKETSLPDNFIISCLYRNALLHDSSSHKVSPVCSKHIKRVMHNRATDIRLMPEIEKPCMADLGKHCLDSRQEGEEIDCLQQNYEVLTEKCKKAIKDFTVMEAKDFDLDRHLVEKCGSMVTKFCQQEMKNEDGGDILKCLIHNKNDADMDPLCTHAVEHWQLIEWKDIEFSPKLKESCYEDVNKLCARSKSKFDAVRCLSQKIVEDYKQVSKQCRNQIKKEIAVQTENIQLSPEMYTKCKDDIDLFCAGVPPGGAQIEECLRVNYPKLQNAECKQLLFKREELESKNVDVDYRLMQVCHPMIKKYCHALIGNGDSTQIMECLRAVTHDIEMSDDCRAIVTERQKEQARSFFLDPELSKFCINDVQRHCKEAIKTAQKHYDNNEFDDGIVFGCLVDVLVSQKKRLQKRCEQYVRRRERESALELELNPQFLQQCRDEIKHLCPVEQPEGIIDCMKMNIKKIKGHGCVEEVRKMINEGIEDVHVDPFLEEVCARDIHTYCQDMPKKSGSVVFCLIDVHKAKNLRLKPNCDDFISERIKLYSDAKVDFAQFDGVSSVIGAISESPHRNYIYMTIMCFLAILFLGGILFGRVTKRVLREQKNR